MSAAAELALVVPPSADPRPALRAMMGNDMATLEEIYDAHGAAVTRRLYRLCGDPEVARDLCQDAFVVAMGKLDELRDERALGAWLHGIAYNLLRDHRRSRARKRSLWQRWLGRGEDPSTPALPAAGQTDEQQLLLSLDAALRGLDDDKRDAFVLRQIEGLSLAEAAELLGVSVQTVSYRAKQAEAHVRAAFEPS